MLTSRLGSCVSVLVNHISCSNSRTGAVLLLTKSRRTGICFSNENARLKVDSWIQNLHDKSEQRSKNNAPIKTARNTNGSEIRSKQNSAQTSSLNREDSVVDKLITDCISKMEFGDAFATLRKYAVVNRYPSRNTCLKLVAISSSKSNFEFLNLVRRTVKVAYPKEYEWQMEYQHYLAEALWKTAKYKEAIEMFEVLFYKYPKRIKKLTDLVSFLANFLVNQNLEEELDLLVVSAQRISKAGYQNLIANIWAITFLSNNGRMNFFSWKIVDENPEMKPYVETKTDKILSLALEQKRTDIFQRLIETVMRLNIDNEYSKVLSAFLDFQCTCEDYSGAMETFRYAKSQNILLSGASIASLAEIMKKKNKTSY